MKYRNGKMIDASYINFNDFQILYPTSKVSIGSTWDRTWQNNDLMSVTVLVNYKIIDITSNVVKIRVTQSLSSLLSDMKKTGIYNIDRNTGIINSVELSAKLRMGGKLTTSISKLE